MTDASEWPAMPRAQWAATCETLHMYVQVVGKIRTALTRQEPQWANVPLSVSARGLTTNLIPYGPRAFQIDFDFIAHNVVINVSDATTRTIPLTPQRSVAQFYDDVMAALRALAIDVQIWTMPVEVPNPVRFTEDTLHATYDPEAVQRFWHVLLRVTSAFMDHRAPFRGRHTTIQFFWGTFDLAYARFSGRPADPPPNADAGFWPGDDRFPEAAFFCYAYPKPLGLELAAIRPAAAFWSETLGEFVLRYDDVRTSPTPHADIVAFLDSTYEAAATLAKWDRDSLG